MIPTGVDVAAVLAGFAVAWIAGFLFGLAYVAFAVVRALVEP